MKLNVCRIFFATVANRKSTWIGLSDAASEGTFEWVTGEGLGYTNWIAGEPNNSNTENYVALSWVSGGFAGDFNSGKWNDLRESGNNGGAFNVTAYVVEIDAAAVPIPAAGILLLGALAGFGALAHRRSRNA
jgi:hypothetical protein